MATIRNSAKAIIVRDRKLLCIECADANREGVFYGLPGGGQQHGETLVEALKRECLEEVSAQVEVHDLQFVREYRGCNHGFPEYRDVHQIEFLFLCTLKDGAEPQLGMVADDSQVGIAWLPIDRLTEFQLYPLALRSALSNLLIVKGQKIGDEEAPYQPVIYRGDVN